MSRLFLSSNIFYLIFNVSSFQYSNHCVSFPSTLIHIILITLHGFLPHLSCVFNIRFGSFIVFSCCWSGWSADLEKTAESSQCLAEPNQDLGSLQGARQ